VEADRRARLLGVALRALVIDRLGDGFDASCATEVTSMGRGVALVYRQQAWVLVDDRHDSALGPAVAWATSAGATSLQLLAPQAAGLLARRATGFAPERFPIEVWQVEDRLQTPAVAEALPADIRPRPEHLELADLIAGAGADVVVEHGVVAGEVAGLEVCRAVTDPQTDGVRLEVGVGAHDREAFTLLHGDVPVARALADVVASVQRHRRRGAEPHPLNRLARERLLRHQLIEHPDSLGLRTLEPAAPPVPRRNVKDAVPCVARGLDARGAEVLVVCSHGIDLDVVPFALDARMATQPTATVIIAVEGRNAHPVQSRLAGLASGDVRLLAVP